MQSGAKEMQYEGATVSWESLWCPDFIAETNYVSKVVVQ